MLIWIYIVRIKIIYQKLHKNNDKIKNVFHNLSIFIIILIATTQIILCEIWLKDMDITPKEQLNGIYCSNKNLSLIHI